MSKLIEVERETVDQMKEYISTLESLLAEYDKVMEAIPECPKHGHQCVPYAIEWVEEQKKHTLAFVATS